MQEKKRGLLILNRQQFGYHTDTYCYCRYLNNTFDIQYLGWDYGRPRKSADGVTVVYVSRDGSRIVRYSRLLFQSVQVVRQFKGIVFVKYFPGCALVGLFAKRAKVVLDIRTASVSSQWHVRTLADFLMRIEARLFDRITIISESLAHRLGLPSDKVHVLPLGADVISDSACDVEGLHLIYVGTLQNRKIEDTIKGLKAFLGDEGKGVSCSYRIIGSGPHGEEDRLRQLVRDLGLDPVVKVLGYVPQADLAPYFRESNVGVSYVPVTEYYDAQPPTKTFEYLLSGLAVIATNTSENKRVINSSNGVLIESTSSGFRRGLNEIWRNREQYDSGGIRSAASPYKWVDIIQHNLHRYLEVL